MLRYLFRRDTILATIMVFMVMGLLSLIPLNTHVLDPIKLALQDFDYNDMAYSKFGKNSEVGVDTNIVIVNIEDADRGGIVNMLEKIATYQPAAIGVDVLFNQPKEPGTDSLLRSFFENNKKAVLAYNLHTEKGVAKPEGFLFNITAHQGYANFVGEEAGTIRYFAPTYYSFDKKNTSYQSFSSAVMRMADPMKLKGFLQRKKKTEQINYSRTADKYQVLSRTDLMSDSGQISLEKKIVLVGFIPADPYSIEDKHFTPFNEKAVGKSVPDMPGLMIHANILSMMNDGDYINKWPAWLVWTLAVLLCWLHMAVFIRYFIDKHIWFHLVAKIAQIVSAILIVYLGLLFFYKWDIKINLTPSFVAIILAVDVLYFYEAIVAWLHKKFGFHSLFVHHAH